MRRHFEDDLQELHALVLRLGGHAEAAIVKAIQALMERDVSLAQQVVDEDDIADRLEVQIDDLCLQLLARHQIVGNDLRLVTCALKIAPDLERISDLASNVAQRVIDLLGEPRLENLLNVTQMAERAQTMLRRALDAYVNKDAELALDVIGQDRQMDSWMEDTFHAGVHLMQTDTATIARTLRVLMIAKSLERIGDNVTNVCEMVVWMIEAQVIRHREIDS